MFKHVGYYTQSDHLIFRVGKHGITKMIKLVRAAKQSAPHHVKIPVEKCLVGASLRSTTKPELVCCTPVSSQLLVYCIVAKSCPGSFQCSGYVLWLYAAQAA